jgi:hypothetical protein
MSNDPSPGLLKTHLNVKHAKEMPSTLHSNFLTLEHEEVKARVQKKESEGFNKKIWNLMRDTQDEAVSQTKHCGSSRIYAKLTYCWAFNASKKSRINHDQALAIYNNLVDLPDIKTITGLQAGPTDDGPPVAARTTQDKVDSVGPAQTANDKEHPLSYQKQTWLPLRTNQFQVRQIHKGTMMLMCLMPTLSITEKRAWQNTISRTSLSFSRVSNSWLLNTQMSATKLSERRWTRRRL